MLPLIHTFSAFPAYPPTSAAYQNGFCSLHIFFSPLAPSRCLFCQMQFELWEKRPPLRFSIHPFKPAPSATPLANCLFCPPPAPNPFSSVHAICAISRTATFIFCEIFSVSFFPQRSFPMLVGARRESKYCTEILKINI